MLGFLALIAVPTVLVWAGVSYPAKGRIGSLPSHASDCA